MTAPGFARRVAAACVVVAAAAFALTANVARGAAPQATNRDRDPAATIAPEPAVLPDAPQALAARVLAIFDAKCVECHGAGLSRPKGGFGYVLDLARVAGNPDMIVRGQPEESEIYRMVVTNEMPGEESGIPPLTPEELQVVKRWIEIGAPAAGVALTPPPDNIASGEATAPKIADASAARAETSAPVAAATAPGDAARTPGAPFTDAPGSTASPSPAPASSLSSHRQASPTPMPARELTFGQRLIRAIGQFHPPSAHFPIAMLVAAAPAEVMWQRTRRRGWGAVVRFCVMLGAATAVLTAVLGWCAAAFSSYSGEAATVLPWHRWVGTATAVWAAFTAALCELSHADGRPRWLRRWFRFSLAIGVALVGISGFLGAALLYGLNHYRW